MTCQIAGFLPLDAEQAGDTMALCCLTLILMCEILNAKTLNIRFALVLFPQQMLMEWRC